MVGSTYWMSPAMTNEELSLRSSTGTVISDADGGFCELAASAGDLSREPTTPPMPADSTAMPTTANA